jgi:hypothetical protein
METTRRELITMTRLVHILLAFRAMDALKNPLLQLLATSASSELLTLANTTGYLLASIEAKDHMVSDPLHELLEALLAPGDSTESCKNFIQLLQATCAVETNFGQELKTVSTNLD